MDFRTDLKTYSFHGLNEFEQKYAPDKLYYAGDISLLESGTRVSVVGSRKVSKAGIVRAKHVARMLVDHGIIVVSGLAEGVDTVAHRTAIRRDGKTIGVLGTPMDQAYPKSNAELQLQMMQEYLVISQFDSGKPVTPRNFPIRNRTMALISDATIIVEASEKSGTRHQGWEALRLGRTLILLENVAEDPQLSWPKKMIEYGAVVMNRDNADRILENLPSFTSNEEIVF